MARPARPLVDLSSSWLFCRRALVGFSTFSTTLFESAEPFIKAQLEQVRTLVSPALDSFAEHALAAQTALYESNNPLVKQVLTLLDHPLALQTRAFFDTQLITRIVLTLFILQAGRYNVNRLAKRKLARAHSDTPDMVDFGLGSAGFGSASGSRGQGDHGEIELHWAGNKFRVPLPPPNSPLSALKAVLFNMTGVPPDHQKLVTAGAVLRDDLAPLSSFGLVDPVAPGADGESASTPSFWDTWSFKSGKKSKPLKKVMMLGSKEVSGSVNDRLASRSDLKHVQEQEEQQAVEKPKDDEDTVVAKIAALVKGAMDEWGPKIVGLESYLAQKTGTEAPVDPEADPVEAPVEVEKPNPRTAAWLSEVLLQSLLKLDSIDIPSTYTVARKERKDAVRQLQACLDRVDAYMGAAAKL